MQLLALTLLLELELFLELNLLLLLELLLLHHHLHHVPLLSRIHMRRWLLSLKLALLLLLGHWRTRDLWTLNSLLDSLLKPLLLLLELLLVHSILAMERMSQWRSGAWSTGIHRHATGHRARASCGANYSSIAWTLSMGCAHAEWIKGLFLGHHLHLVVLVSDGGSQAPVIFSLVNVPEHLPPLEQKSLRGLHTER